MVPSRFFFHKQGLTSNVCFVLVYWSQYSAFFTYYGIYMSTYSSFYFQYIGNTRLLQPSQFIKIAKCFFRYSRKWSASYLLNHFTLQSYTERKVRCSGFVGPQSSCEGQWIIAMWLHVRNKFIIGNDGCLL